MAKDPHRAFVDEAEVVVVGAGPAGSRCAIGLTEKGHEVLLLDKTEFPREKPCGDGVTDTSVGVLDELGLGELVARSKEIRGLRAFFDHAAETRSFSQPSRCIPRWELDQHLFDAACERGARFARVRIDGPLIENDCVTGVTTSDGKAIRARCVIAADGATSRLRRGCGFSSTPLDRRPYAVRQYFRSELALAPFFDVFVPLVFESTELLGYGWVFPVDENTANVGVGYYRHNWPEPQPPLTAVLHTFVAELESHQSQRYGRLKSEGKPLGSPVGVGFGRERCQFQGILFVGDAAGMTDPLTGEGIGNALHGGGLVAQAAHVALTGKRGPDWHRGLDLGLVLDRRMLRLGQDVDLLRRLGAGRLARRESRLVSKQTKIRREPFLGAAARAAASSYTEPDLNDTPVARFASERDPKVGGAINALNDKALDELSSPLPFLSTIVYSRLQSDLGPALATITFLTSRAANGSLSAPVISTALALELVAMFPIFLLQTVNRPRSDLSKVNNAFAILTADHIVSRSLESAAVAGPRIVSEVAAAGCSICEREALNRSGTRGSGLAREAYLDAVRGREGVLFSVAARAGAQLAGIRNSELDALCSFAEPLGSAFRIANDIRSSASNEAQPADSSALLQTRRGVDALLECELMADRARGALADIGIHGTLAEICDLPVELARSLLSTPTVLP
jgi:menaquinone-9 beta-reductase